MTQSPIGPNPDHFEDRGLPGVTHEDQSATHTLEIQIEIEPLPHGRFRGVEGITLDWQQMTPFMWARLVNMARRGQMAVLTPLALDLTIQQRTGYDGDAGGGVTVLKASITNYAETVELEPKDRLVGCILEDPNVTEAIWAAAEEKQRLG